MNNILTSSGLNTRVFQLFAFLENTWHERLFANQQNESQISNLLSVLNCCLYSDRLFINIVTSPL